MIDGFTKNEKLIGNIHDQLYLKRELEKKRLNVNNSYLDYVSLDSILIENKEIDSEYFLDKLSIAQLLIQSLYKSFKIIPFERYLIYKKKRNSLGGFYDLSSGGFHYLTIIGYTSLLNKNRVNCKKLISIELLRNFIHDCIHYSTYRTFKISMKNDKPIIYRAQYGINFRNEKGQSYTSPALTDFIPKAINLNLLMDGVNAFYTKSIINSITSIDEFKITEPIEFNIYNDLINLDIKNFEVLDNLPNKFYNEVVSPCKIFIENWGGNPFIHFCISAMLKGDFDIIKKYFDIKSGDKNYIEKFFKQKEFKF